MVIRALTVADAGDSSALHAEVLDMEFLSRFGTRFLRRYHRAWIDSPAALALAAVDEHGRIVGALLGSLRPAEHYRHLLRRHGPGLAVSMAFGAAARPRLAAELVRTRARRYAGAIARQASALLRRRPGGDVTGGGRTVEIGEITHVMVSTNSRREGVGRELMTQATRAARAAGVGELVLVTPPELPAVGFYLDLGWEQGEQLVSRSGEEFVRFRLPLGGAENSAP
ncbi:MAG: GNAT family N-acetyltransferase [Acidimicrobiales bacterium]